LPLQQSLLANQKNVSVLDKQNDVYVAMYKIAMCKIQCFATKLEAKLCMENITAHSSLI